MTREQWEVKTEQDNRGKPLPTWCWGEYELCENVNLALEGGWVYELTHRGRRVDLYPTLNLVTQNDGQRCVSDHV